MDWGTFVKDSPRLAKINLVWAHAEATLTSAFFTSALMCVSTQYLQAPEGQALLIPVIAHSMMSRVMMSLIQLQAWLFHTESNVMSNVEVQLRADEHRDDAACDHIVLNS